MRFKTWQDVDAAGYTDECGPLYRVDTVVFDEDDEGCLDAEFWYDRHAGIWSHWFDCFFTDLDEARRWCSLFDQRTALWTLTHGNGRRFENVGAEIMLMEWVRNDWEPNYAVDTYDWMGGERLEEWHDLDMSDECSCRV